MPGVWPEPCVCMNQVIFGQGLASSLCTSMFFSHPFLDPLLSGVSMLLLTQSKPWPTRGNKEFPAL